MNYDNRYSKRSKTSEFGWFAFARCLARSPTEDSPILTTSCSRPLVTRLARP